MDSDGNMQIIISSPDLQIPSRSIIMNPNQTIQHLKQKFLPKTIPSQTLDSLYFTYHGKPLTDTSTISSNCNLNSPISNLTLRIRVCGGGGDGGATGAESRDCYLNMYAVKKPDKVDPNETRLSKWTTCALSFEPLKPPCVIDQNGNVFNKESLVEALLGKKLPKGFGHIKGLKDMIPIHLSQIPKKKNDTDDVDNISFDTKFQCPVAGVELNGKYKFFALRSCGHVLSAKALKEVKSSSTCIVCHKEYTEFDKIVINGSEEEVAELKERMELEKAKLREKVKEKKKMKVKSNVGLKEEEEMNNVSSESSKLSGMKHGIEEKDVELVKNVGNGKIGGNKAGSSLVKEESNGVPKKKFKATDIAPPNATKVYASIFTSSRKSDFKETYSCRSLPLGRN
ncbi:protein RTF2 homolog [Papaver somniferum]|uniref:protein RTF2 homolog n=1 Tax=Papaver somniferum TaxID=3469 RepID=UPI000E6FE105|nr:protein RTF2 homolog [Papaver somniferum]